MGDGQAGMGAGKGLEAIFFQNDADEAVEIVEEG